MKIKLKHADFCDGCDQIKDLATLAQHKRCLLYKKNMLPMEDIFIASRGVGSMKRPDICKKENEAEIVKAR